MLPTERFEHSGNIPEISSKARKHDTTIGCVGIRVTRVPYVCPPVCLMYGGRVWATEDTQESDWEDDDSMDSAKEVVDVDKVGQNKVHHPVTMV